jgi:hypothetical protein
MRGTWKHSELCIREANVIAGNAAAKQSKQFDHVFRADDIGIPSNEVGTLLPMETRPIWSKVSGHPLPFRAARSRFILAHRSQHGTAKGTSPTARAASTIPSDLWSHSERLLNELIA